MASRPLRSGARQPAPADSSGHVLKPVSSPFTVTTPRRLKRRAEFLKVASKGRKAPSPGLVLQALAREDELPVRLGFTVTKKVGNAVVRNRTKRRLREAARLLLRETPAIGADLVLVGRDTTRTRPFPLLIDDLYRSLRRLGVVFARLDDSGR